MSSKFKKLLLSIIIILAGILISNNVKADVVGGIVTKDDMNSQHYINGSHRFQPTKEGNGILFCIEPGAAFKADMTSSEYTTYKDISESTHQDTKPDLPWTGEKTYMKYTKKSYKAPLDVAYIFATANERNIGIPQNMFMARSVWASSICGTLAQGGTWLSKEAQDYVKWHNTFLDGNGNFKKKKDGNYKDVSFTVEEQDRKAKLAVDQERQKYTVGKFKVEYPGIDGGVGTSSSTKKDNDINLNTTIENLQKLIVEVNKITKIPNEHDKCNMKTEGREWKDFTNAIDSAQDYLDSKIGDICISELADEEKVDTVLNENEFKDIYEKIVSKYNKIIEKQKEVKVKLGGTYAKLINTGSIEVQDKNEKGEYVKTDITVTFKSPIKQLSIEQETTEKDTEYLFSYVSKVQIKCYSDVEGKQEIQGKTLTNDVSKAEFDIIGTNGAKVTNTPVMINNNTEVAYVDNIPKNKEQFYVRFDHAKVQGAKSVKVFVTITYLSGCEANICVYEGNAYTWTWANKSKQTAWQCTTEHEHETTCVTADEWEYWYEKTITGPSARQRLMFIYMNGGKVDAKKNWKDITLNTPTDGVIDITMDIAGHAFIDQDEGKVNTGDNLFKNKDAEGLANVEVSLYECDINGEHEKFTGKITTTLEDGSYIFTQLDAMKKYRVKFVYNGLMYTNVDNKLLDAVYNSEEWKQTSKVDELDRDRWDGRFKEIGSYPQNYEIQNKGIFNELGQYNIAYPQEEIVTYFQEISANMVANGGNLQNACRTVASNNGNTEEAKRKTQFAADCRIEAWTNKDKVAVQDPYGGTNSTYIYPVYDQFTLNGKDVDVNGQELTIGQDKYKPIYEGQRYINCGIKNRATIDLALYKDVYKATVTINGKTEVYNYNKRGQVNNTARINLQPYELQYGEALDENGNDINGTTTFIKGMDETDFLNKMRASYRQYQNRNNPDSNYRGRPVEDDKYNMFMRQEDAYNGVYPETQQDKVKNYDTYDKGDHTNFNKSEKAENTNNGNYYSLAYEDRLKVLVTYKISLRNQASVKASVTEIVDYYDKNYRFHDAYIGNSKGVALEGDSSKVEKHDDSLYNGRGSNEFKSNSYNTMYLRPVKDLTLTSGDKEKYLYVTFELFKTEEFDAGKLISDKFASGQELEVLNLAEINGYKTEYGLIDKDSTPGNFNISGIAQDKFTTNGIVEYVTNNNMIKTYEDDTDRAPAYVFTKQEARTLEGYVFEDYTDDSETIHTNDVRQSDGKINIDKNNRQSDKPIKGVIVQLVEMKNDQQGIIRATSVTNDDGWYGFIGFVPGNYIINYIYGADDATAMRTDSLINQGQNKTSYNGQDYQSTLYNAKPNSYWYKTADGVNDAKDDDTRKQKVINYAVKAKYEENAQDLAIVNHKAEVFNSYLPEQPEHIKQNSGLHKQLIDELEKMTYRNAYTETMAIDMEYEAPVVEGNKAQQEYTHKITGVDFGVVERPRSELVIDQDVKHIKVTASDGVTVLFDTDKATNNLQWISGKEPQDKIRKMLYKGGKITDYDKNELLNVIMDEELIDGATLEVTYGIKITNNGEQDGDATTRAKNIINYVSNNLTFDASENPNWEVVPLNKVQTNNNSTWVHQPIKNLREYEQETFLDLSNQAVILKAKDESPLLKALAPKQSTDEVELKLKKKMSTEGASDNLTYTNMTEIVEIENTVGRYDHGATPGNQDIHFEPQEHDTSGASYYHLDDQYPDKPTGEIPPQDGRIIVTPPTGSTHIYYFIGMAGAIILAVGIYLIKKFVLDKRK